MWLKDSSVGRKVIMSVTGLFLILFVTFHVLMNAVAIFWPCAYNIVCEFLGANWYALIGTAVLAAGFIVHIIYAFWLSYQNKKARGNDAYAVSARPKSVEWASQNMLVLGIVVVLGLLLHLFNFWYNMMFAELIGTTMGHLPSDGFAFIIDTFQNPVYVVLYIVWLVALWFHLTHGFWSAMQTIGISGKLWFNRWRVIGNIYVTLLILAFIAVVVAFAAGLAPSLW